MRVKLVRDAYRTYAGRPHDWWEIHIVPLDVVVTTPTLYRSFYEYPVIFYMCCYISTCTSYIRNRALKYQTTFLDLYICEILGSHLVIYTNTNYPSRSPYFMWDDLGTDYATAPPNALWKQINLYCVYLYSDLSWYELNMFS